MAFRPAKRRGQRFVSSSSSGLGSSSAGRHSSPRTPAEGAASPRTQLHSGRQASFTARGYQRTAHRCGAHLSLGSHQTACGAQSRRGTLCAEQRAAVGGASQAKNRDIAPNISRCRNCTTCKNCDESQGAICGCRSPNTLTTSVTPPKKLIVFLYLEYLGRNATSPASGERLPGVDVDARDYLDGLIGRCLTPSTNWLIRGPTIVILLRQPTEVG